MRRGAGRIPGRNDRGHELRPWSQADAKAFARAARIGSRADLHQCERRASRRRQRTNRIPRRPAGICRGCAVARAGRRAARGRLLRHHPRTHPRAPAPSGGNAPGSLLFRTANHRYIRLQIRGLLLPPGYHRRAPQPDGQAFAQARAFERRFCLCSRRRRKAGRGGRGHFGCQRGNSRH